MLFGLMRFCEKRDCVELFLIILTNREDAKDTKEELPQGGKKEMQFFLRALRAFAVRFNLLYISLPRIANQCKSGPVIRMRKNSIAPHGNFWW